MARKRKEQKSIRRPRRSKRASYVKCLQDGKITMVYWRYETHYLREVGLLEWIIAKLTGSRIERRVSSRYADCQHCDHPVDQDNKSGQWRDIVSW